MSDDINRDAELLDGIPIEKEAGLTGKRLGGQYRMTERQRRFVDAYVRTGAVKDSAIEAGYSPKTARHQGHALLHKNPQVRQAIEEKQQALRKSEDITLKDQVRRFERLRDEAELANQYQAAVKAEENIARMMGYLNDRAQVNLNGQFVMNISGIDSDQSPQIEHDARPPLEHEAH